MSKTCKFDHLIICDQARKEDNGKIFLIGIYAGTINIPKVPAKLRLTFWMIGSAYKLGTVKFEIKVDYKSNSGTKTVGPSPFSVEVTDLSGGSELQFGITGVPVEFPELPGTLIVSIREAKSKKWKQLATKAVLPHEPSVSSEPQQPS